ncbi:hypothetical protein ACS0TY_003407 [Phlomoides rotata]
MSKSRNGLGNDHTKNALCFYYRTYRPDWVAIYEPKCFGFVHARSTHIPRRDLWTDITVHANRSLCVMGDFNAVLGAHERSRGAWNPARPS